MFSSGLVLLAVILSCVNEARSGRENSEALLALCSLEMMVGERKLGECSGCAVTTRVARPASHVIVTRGPIVPRALATLLHIMSTFLGVQNDRVY